MYEINDISLMNLDLSLRVFICLRLQGHAPTNFKMDAILCSYFAQMGKNYYLYDNCVYVANFLLF